MQARKPANKMERWWWLAGFLVLSVFIHLFLALHGPGFGLTSAAPSAKEIEISLEPLPAEKKPKAAVKPPQVAKVAEKRPAAVKKAEPKVTAKPLEEKPLMRVARVTPTVKPAAAPTTHTVAPDPTPEPVKTASITPHVSRTHAALTMANPLAALATPEDKPETEPSASAITPTLMHSASARTGLAGGASGGGHSAARGAQTPTEKPTDSGLAGGMHFPKMASRLGGESVMSVKNPLAEDAVPEDKPGFSQGAGGGPGLGHGRGSGGLNGRRLAGLRGGHGPGLGGGVGGGLGAGRGHGKGRGRGTGNGTGTGTSGSGDGDGLDQPMGEGNGVSGVGFGLRAAVVGGGHRSGTTHLAFGGGFGEVGGLLRGEPARAPGDGLPGTNGHGLSAEIYEGQPYLTNFVRHRTDAVINFNWGMVIPVAKGVSRIFSVRWTGKIQPDYSETYTFTTQEDDGLRLWVDGELLVDDWKDHQLTTRRGSIRLEAGRKYDIKIEYFNGPDHARKNVLGHAEAHLRWFSPSQPLETVPQSALWQAE